MLWNFVVTLGKAVLIGLLVAFLVVLIVSIIVLVYSVVLSLKNGSWKK